MFGLNDFKMKQKDAEMRAILEKHGIKDVTEQTLIITELLETLFKGVL